MDGMKFLGGGFTVSCLSGVLVGYMCGMMFGFYAFAGVCLLTAVVLSLMNFEVVKKALDLTPMRVASWLIFLISVIVIAVIYANEFEYPMMPAILVSLLSASYIFHTWYTLEPQKG